MSSPTNHKILSLYLALVALYGGAFLFWKERLQETQSEQTSIPNEEISAPEQTIKLLLVGDIMLDRGVEWQIQKNGGDWKFPFLNIAPELQKADLVFGNLESQISDRGVRVGSMYSFRAEPKAMEGLVYAGFDVLSIANNHSFDYTREAFLDSLSRLKEVGIAAAGGGNSYTEAHAPALKEVKGTKIGILAYATLGSPLWQATDTRPGIAWMDAQRISALQEDIQKAKTLADIIVVSFHGGDEYVKTPNDFQKTLARSAIDAGADIVVGHHPHVVQPLEQYKQGWIAYSLGNFVFDQYFSEETMKGAILKVDVKNKTIQNAVLERTTLNNSFQVEWAE